MFKNRAIQMRFVKTPNPTKTATALPADMATMDPTEISNLLKDQVTHIAVAAGAVIAGVYALHTASEVIINNTNPANR